MLDYKKLSQQSDELFASFTKEGLEKWIAFDERRLMEELTSGKTIGVSYDIFDINYLSSLGSNSDSFFDESEEINYAKSA